MLFVNPRNISLKPHEEEEMGSRPVFIFYWYRRPEKSKHISQINQKVVKKHHSLGWAFSLVELSILLKNGQNLRQPVKGRGDQAVQAGR